MSEDPQMSSILSSVIKKFADREAFGTRKYGTTLDREDLTILDYLRHAQEEAMDTVNYLEKLIRLHVALETPELFEHPQKNERTA